MKKWNPGIADEPWKVMICARDAMRTEDAVSYLVHVLTDAGSDVASGVGQIEGMTGKQIIDGLRQHQRSAELSVYAALKASW